MRPVVRGCCTMGELYGGSLDLDAVALMNDALDCVDENERRHFDRDK